MFFVNKLELQKKIPPNLTLNVLSVQQTWCSTPVLGLLLHQKREQVAFLCLFSIKTRRVNIQGRDSLSARTPEAGVARTRAASINGPEIKCCYSPSPFKQTRSAVTTDIACQKFSFTAHGQHGGQKSKYNGPNRSFFPLSSQQTLNSEMTGDAGLKLAARKTRRCIEREGEKEFVVLVFFSGGYHECWDGAVTVGSKRPKGQGEES